MNVKFSFDGNNFIAGFVLAMTLLSGFSLWWLLLIPFALCDFEIKGMPYIKLRYEDGKLNVDKGRYK